MSDGFDVRCPIPLTRCGAGWTCRSWSCFVLCNLAKLSAWPVPCLTLQRAIWIEKIAFQ